MQYEAFSRRAFLAAAAALLPGCGLVGGAAVKTAEKDAHAAVDAQPADDGHGVAADPAKAAVKSAYPAPAGAAPKSAAKDTHASAKGAPTVKELAPSFGPTYVIANKVVNLADPGSSRFLRFSIAIEFKPHTTDEKHGATSSNQLALYDPQLDVPDYHEVTGGKEDPEKAFLATIKKYVPAMEDAVVSTLTSRTTAELASANGRDAAKREIAIRVQRLLGTAEQVTNVYFTEFVFQ